MQNWEYKKLGELSTEKMSYGTSASSCEYDGEVRYIRITDINDEGHLNDDFVSPESYEEKHVLQDGDIVFARTGATVGKAYCYHESGEKYVYAGYLIRLRPNKQLVNSDYLYYCTKSKDYLEFIRTSQAAAAQPNVNAEKYSNFEIPLPPLEEQKRIVKILDEKFAMLETVKANSKANLQNAKDLFQSQLTKAFSNTTWEKKRLGDLTNEKMSYGSSSPSCEYDSEVRYIRITDINERGFLNEEYVSPQFFEEKHILIDGDIVFARTGATVGKAYCYHNDDGKCVYAGYLIRLRPNRELVVPEYIYLTTKSKEYEEFIRTSQAAAAQPNVNAEKYSNFEIPLPPLPEQKRIVEQLDSLSEKVRSLEEIYTKQLANCDELKQAFLKKAFDGEL